MNRPGVLHVLLGTTLLGSGSLLAAERVWNGADGANWTDAAVWTTNGVIATVPENKDTVTITNGTTVNLTSAALTESNFFALVQLAGNARGTLRVGPGGYLPTANLSVSQTGTGPTTPGHLIVDGGSVCATNIQLFGVDNVNSPATLDILNSGNYTSTAAFRVYNGRVLVSNSTFNATFTTYLHGSTATSLFEIVDSTVNLTALAIGRDVGNSLGKVCRNILRVRSGTLNMSGTLEVGWGGLSTASITGVVEQIGGTVTIGGAGMISMPVNAYAAGFYNLNGGLLSLVNGGDSMRIGGRDAAGKGYFLMTDGVLTNKGTVYLGTATGGYGKFEQSGGVSYFQKPLQIGATTNATGDLNLLGGTLNLSAAGANIDLGNYSNALGRCYVGGGLLNAASYSIYIGSASFGNGTFVQNGGVVSNASTVIGSAYTSSGALILSNGLFFTTSGLNLGNVSNSTGSCEVDNGLLSVNGAISVGVASNSVGTFVMNGGTLTNSGFSVGNQLGTTGALTMNGGQVYSSGDVLLGNGIYNSGGVGSFSLAGGKVLTATRLVVGGYGSGYATVSGGEIEAVGASVNLNQKIVIGRDPGTFGSLVMTGGVLKGTNIFIIARDGGSTGAVAVAGGDLYVNALQRGAGLSALNLAGGTLHPYSRDTTFAFAATLTNTIGYGATGALFGLSPVDKDGVVRTVAATCTFTGNGGLAKRDGGTVYLGGSLTYTGNTTVEAGTLALSNTVASLSSATITVASNATLDVSLNRSAPFVITNGQTLAGSGSVTGAIRLASGAFIGGGTTNAPGVLTLNGDLTMESGSTLLFNMARGAYGRVHVTGNLVLPSNANLIVSGVATNDAQGRVMLTWDGALSMPSATHWSVTGEKAPLAVLSADSKTLTLSYIKGTIILVN